MQRSPSELHSGSTNNPRRYLNAVGANKPALLTKCLDSMTSTMLLIANAMRPATPTCNDPAIEEAVGQFFKFFHPRGEALKNAGRVSEIHLRW